MKKYEDTAIFMHMCCNSGYNMLKQYILDHPNTKIDNVSYFNVRDRMLDQRCNFDLESLREFSYILESNGNLIKEANVSRKE